MSEVSFVVFSEQDEVCEALRKVIEIDARARVAAATTNPNEIAAVIREAGPDVLFVDLGYAPHETLDLLQKLDLPPGGFVVCGPPEDNEVILRAFRQGAREFLGLCPSETEVAEMIEKLAIERPSARTAPTRAPIIAVMGTKGGVGATLVACQLAAELQLAGQRTAVVDLNFPLGDVALHFDLQPAYTLADVANSSEKIDETLVGGLLSKHSKTGVEVLAAPSRVEDSELIEDAHVESVLAQLRGRFDRIVVDVSRSWNPISVRVLEEADSILLVTLQDVPALNHARTHRDLLLRLGVSASKIRTVVNRHSADAGVSDADMSRFLGAAPDFSLPNDYATAISSVNEGRSVGDVAPSSSIHEAFQTLSRHSFEWLGLEPPAGVLTSAGGSAWYRKVFKKIGRK